MPQDPFSQALSNPLSAFIALQNPQVLQLLSMITNARQQEEDRAMKLEDRKLQREQITRQQADADTKLQMTLANAGAVKGSAPLERALSDVFGAPADPRPEINTRLGTYYTPTIKEKTTRELDILTAKEGAKAAAELAAERAKIPVKAEQAAATERATQPFKTTAITFPATGSQAAMTVNVPNSSVASARKAIEDINSGKSYHSFETDASGNVALAMYDVGTKQKTLIPFGNIGKPMAEPASEKMDEKSIEARADEEALEHIKKLDAEIKAKDETLPPDDKRRQGGHPALNTFVYKDYRDHPDYRSARNKALIRLRSEAKKQAKTTKRSAGAFTVPAVELLPLTQAQIQAYADANGWTYEQARSYLSSTKKYKLP